MDNYSDIFEISEEFVAAWIDGNLTSEDEAIFMERLSSDTELADILNSYEDVESVFEKLVEFGCDFPEDFLFDLHIPVIDIENFNELPTSYNQTSFDYNEIDETLDSHEVNDNVCISDDLDENLSVSNNEEFEFF